MARFFVQELILERHFMLIDSPIPFELVANPTNFIRDVNYSIVDAEKVTGRDICSRPAGAWRVDCHKLLSENYHKNNPVFTMLIKYDMDLLHEGENVDIRYSDIDIGEGIAGVNGQLVNICADDLRPVVLGMEAQGELTRAKLDSLDSTMASVRTAQADSNTLLSAVRDAVLEVNNGSVNNKMEQIRTLLKSPIGSNSGVYNSLQSSISSGFELLKNLISLNTPTVNSFEKNALYVGRIQVVGYNSRHITFSGLFMTTSYRLVSIFGRGTFDIANNDYREITSFTSPLTDTSENVQCSFTDGSLQYLFSNYINVYVRKIG